MMTHRRSILLTAILALLLSCFLPQESHAAGLSLDECTDGVNDAGVPWRSWEFTGKVVRCIKVSIKQATVTMLNELSDYMTPIVSAMIIIAIATFGIRTAGGEPGIMRRGMGLLLRLGLIWMFYYNMGGLAMAPFDFLDEIIRIVTGNEPWYQIDLYLGKITGAGEGSKLSKGLLGLMGAAALSSTAGGVMFIAGLSALINLLLFIFRVVFTYLSAVTVIAFMIVISPFIIPLAIFFYTERYFIKWLDIILSAMLVPILLFAFLALFLSIFNDLIWDIFNTLCGSSNPNTNCANNPAYIDFSAFWKTNEPKFGWLIPADPHFAGQVQNAAGAAGPGTPAVQTNINPLLRRAQDTMSFTTPGVDFGPSNVSIMQQLIWQFLALWIFASFMKSVVDKVPEIAANIANAASGITMEPTQLENTARKGWGKAQAALLGKR